VSAQRAQSGERAQVSEMFGPPSSRSLLDRLVRYYRRRSGSLLFRNRLAIHPEQPLISFTFDDFPRCALLVGGSILERHGLAATYYASLGLMGKNTETGEIFLAEDLRRLVERGHELGCHTFAHCDAWSTNSAAFEESIVENRRALARILPEADFKSFAYPISLPAPLTKARTVGHFLCCRGGGQRINHGVVDRNQLSAYFLEKSRGEFKAIKGIIDLNQREQGWLILATHDVSDAPTAFGCTPEFFEQVVDYAVRSGARILPVARALQVLDPSTIRQSMVPLETTSSTIAVQPPTPVGSPAGPLVSILIPAFNAENWIADTIRSAMAQTWENKEIIVVDDGSTDQTLAVARQFESSGVRVHTQKNQGGAAARNTCFRLSRGDYIQWLDADDLLCPEKIARQMGALDLGASKRIALSAAFGRFRYRWYCAEFLPTELWADLSPAEWLVRKLGQNLYMQTATWLVSRELAEAAGPWDTRMLSDDDGEYFSRLLLKSDGVRFVPDAKVYYRAFRYDGLAYVGKSERKMEALWLSMQLHIGYLRSLRDTERERNACLAYLQRNLIHFYPDKKGIVRAAEQTAQELGGKLRSPHLSWKYSWIKILFGWIVAKNASLYLRKLRWATLKQWDKVLFRVQNRGHQRDIPTMSGQQLAPALRGSEP
jgi:glycosyltransferase involved in cell wall biosynthesis/peptidoglycan/xylan/chitin deacetylase (PgdA/CDA1 family)